MLDPMLQARISKWQKAPGYFPALLEALQFRNADLEPMRQLDPTEWNELLFFSDRAHLTLLLSQLSSDVLPGWVASRIQKNLSDNTKRIEHIKTLYQEAEYALRGANAEHIVIKGFTQYPDYVKSPNLRAQSDIDLFCPPQAILPARDALLRLGYKPKPAPKYATADHFPPMLREGGWRWRGNPFDPEMPPAINLHYCLWNEQTTRLRIPQLDAFWYRRVTREMGGFAFPVLDPIDHIGLCSLHVLRGLLRSDWVIHDVYEVAYFLNAHAHDHRLWKNWRESHSDSLRSLEAISFSLARRWFGCNVAVEAEEQILALPLPIQQWFDCFCSSPLEGMFAPSRDGVWLHLGLLASSGAKLSVLRKTLLPVGIPSMAVGQSGFSANCKPPQARSKYRPVNYAIYVSQRADDFLHALFHGMSSGIRYWRSHRKFGPPFWKFFAAACFWSLGFSIFFSF